MGGLEMLLTVFHRATMDVYAPPCEIADQPVLDLLGNPAGYFACAWGEHVAEAALHQGITTVDGIDTMLLSWGLQRAPEPVPPDIF